MNLHKNPQEFYDTLLVLGNRLNTSPAIIEKDYYVTMFLEALAKRVPKHNCFLYSSQRYFKGLYCSSRAAIYR